VPTLTRAPELIARHANPVTILNCHHYAQQESTTKTGMTSSSGSSGEQSAYGIAAFTSGAARMINSRSSSMVSGVAID
jgi:hypothetical protein